MGATGAGVCESKRIVEARRGGTDGDVPQGLKPDGFSIIYGPTKVVP